MRSKEYWKKRAEQTANAQHLKADEYAAALKREYDSAMRSIQKDIESFYNRFAVNNSVATADAKKLLTTGELKEFRWELEEFIAKANNNLDGRWTKQLDNAYFRTRISRLEALQIQIIQEVEMLATSRNNSMQDILTGVYADTYYQTIFNVQSGTGIGTSFTKIDTDTVKKVVAKLWIGSNFSNRIWIDKDKLIKELRTNLTQSFIRGDSLDRTTQALAKRMGVSYSNAARLVTTETAHIVGEATFDGYKASGVVKEYEFLATLDRRTSQICQSMDGRVFKLSEKEEGVNYPPLHARCRSTTVAHFGDEEVSVRLAKDDSGNYEVPSNMTYEQWKKKYVDSR